MLLGRWVVLRVTATDEELVIGRLSSYVCPLEIASNDTYAYGKGMTTEPSCASRNDPCADVPELVFL